MASLIELTNTRILLEQLMERAEQRYKNEMEELSSNYAYVTKEINLVGAGIDVDKILLAESILEMRGTFAKGGQDRHAALRDAIDDLATGGNKLVREYFGTKDYDRWHGQRCDCEYGMGPRHGHIIFSIGLKHEVRQRITAGTPLSDEEREAAIYYLVHLETIERCSTARFSMAEINKD